MQQCAGFFPAAKQAGQWVHAHTASSHLQDLAQLHSRLTGWEQYLDPCGLGTANLRPRLLPNAADGAEAEPVTLC